jgi:nucleotide-binding universal stress UspA family protein
VNPLNRPIVAGFDPQTLDRSPVQFAVTAARLTGSRLIVVSACALTPVEDSLPLAFANEELALLGDQSFAELQSELDAADVSIDYREIRGTSAAHALYEVAEEEAARLLVVGSTSRGPIGQVFPGSTAGRLMHAAPCAVAVVPHAWTGGTLDTIGVAYAQTDEGFEALRGAHALAERSGACLRVLSVVQVQPSMYRDIGAGTTYEPGRNLLDIEGDRIRELETAMRDAVARLPGLASDLHVEFDAFVGDPADTLNRVSANLDLLVCGSRGYGPLRAAVLGGVSRRLMAEASCPVIVLARGIEAPLEPMPQPVMVGDAGRQ